MRVAALVLSALWATGSLACEYELEGGTAVERLSGPLRDWHETWVTGSCRTAVRQGWSWGFARHERFGLTDWTGSGAWSTPLDGSTGITLDLQVGPGARVLPRNGLGVAFDRSFGGGWVGHLGARRNDYRDGHVGIGQVTVERYVADHRFAWVYSQSFLSGAGSAGSHRLHWDRWYTERSRAGIVIAFGREVERVGSAALLVTDVRSIGLHGRHWFTEHWALAWSVGFHEQGDLYDRHGLRLGLRHRF